MKKIVSIITVLFGLLWGGLPLAPAAMIYTEDWGNANTAIRANGTLNQVGWTGVAQTQTAQPYLGIYGAAGASDPFLGLGLPPNTVYFTGLTSGGSQTNGAGMFYTVNGAGAGTAGDSAFTSIDPTLYPNLTFNVDVRNGGGNLTNYFAVRVGGVWYAATQNQMPVYTGSYPTFTNWTMAYTTSASAWNIVTVNSTYVTIGAQPGSPLSGLITGIGIVELNNTNVTGGGVGFNYNNIVINQGLSDFPSDPASITAPAITPQTVYVGGGASFLIAAAGSPTLAYSWRTNGVPVTGARYIGANTTMLTITNINANDALPTYSVVVTNFFGKATNDSLALTVNPVPSGYLYAETFPYVGPNGNLPLSGVGWQAVAPAGSFGIYSPGPGLGDVFSYSANATTNAYFTTLTNDTGLSGLPFVAIPISSPTITLQADFTPGNGQGQVPGDTTVYWAVEVTGGAWYSSAQPVGISLAALNNYQQSQLAFDPAAVHWKSLTIDPVNTMVTMGLPAGGPLTGNIIGAGLIFVHSTSVAGGDINFRNFAITANVVTVVAPSITSALISQSVASGGGASFGVAATGTQPFSYSWSVNSSPVSNGGRFSGSTTPVLTIANLNASDSSMVIVATVTNPSGSDNSSVNFFPPTLTVTNPPVGMIYTERFPYVGPTGNDPISGVGWVGAVSGGPNPLFQISGSEGAASAFFGSPATAVYYTTTATDTNQAGLPFPNINLASYGSPSSLDFSVDIAPNNASSNVTAFVAVQIGTNWYVAANPLPVPTATDSPTYSTYNMAFNPAAANWDNLTVTSAGGIIGSPAAGNLKGVMTGAGLVFVYVGSGGNFNFSNFIITGTGVGGINVGSLASGSIPLTWVGNPVVKLQSSTSLSVPNWQDVPNTYGLYSLPVSVAGPQQFYRLKTP
jgi:hypothetical protein